MSDRWLVPLPPGAQPPYRVFVNGVPQAEGEDYRVEGHALSFARPLVKEGKLGVGRWTLMFFAIMGSYGRNDSVDVEYTVAGQPRVATGLDIVAPGTSSDPPA